jgi:uncharacterized protein YjbI with pentapeptide repeats
VSADGVPAHGERWSGDDGTARARAVVDRLVGGQPLDDLGLGQVDGRIDLRGLRSPLPVVLLTGARVEGLDLGGAHIPSWRFDGCVVDGCRFDGATCRDWRLWRTQVRRCGFAGADLSDSAVGTWDQGEGNLWSHVDLRDADLRVLLNRGATYEDCELAGADLTGVVFEQCTLRRCHFAGDLRQVTFDGRAAEGRPVPGRWEDVDLRAARFDQVHFLDVDLAGVALPTDAP